MSAPGRVAVIGSQVSICSAAGALELLKSRLELQAGGYVCFTNAHTAVMGRRDERFRAVTNGSFLSVADGKPVYWTGRMKGAGGLGHVPGPDFMWRVLSQLPQYRHFFYGSTPAVLSSLTTSVRERIPGVNICGSLSPPFRALAREELAGIYREILQARPDFVWVGLGAPKQELWMAEAWPELRPAILLGVGAAFDFHAGTIRRAPATIRHVGLEWLHRLFQEPRRLWRRYLVTNSLFIYYAVRDALSPRSAAERGT
jgi:N-acetylglucosaminyldiphosphoundecaprenol N-acetyl-beta-D-mannosaminyltransferase